MPFNFSRNNPYVDYAQGQNAAPAQSNGLSDQSLLTGGYDPGLMQKVGNFLPGLVGLKDIDYPYIRSQIVIKNGVASIKEGGNYSLDYKKGDAAGRKDAAALGQVAVDRANQLLQTNGMYGQEGLNTNFDIGMASGRKGSNLGTGMFVGSGGSFKSGSTHTGLDNMSELGTKLDQYLSDTIKGGGWGELTEIPQYGESNFVPSQGAGSFDNTSVVGRMLLNAAAMAAGGYAFNALSAPATAGDLATSSILDVGTSIGGEGVIQGVIDGTIAASNITPGITAAMTGGATGLNAAGNIATTALTAAGSTPWSLPNVPGAFSAPDLITGGTEFMDPNLYSGTGNANTTNVLNTLDPPDPGAITGEGQSGWDKLTDAGKKVFTDPDGTVNWTRVARAGLLGANVLSGVLGSVPDGGGDGSGGAGQNPYVAPDWVTGKLPDRPDPGNYMDRTGEWTPGLSPGEQSNLLAMGKAPPKDYTQNNAVPFQPQRMLVDPSLNTLPKQQNMPALPSTAQGGLASVFQNVDPNRPAGSIDSERRQGFGGLGGIDPNYVPTGNSPFSNMTPEQIEALRRQNPNPNRGGRQAAPGGLPPLQALQSLSNLPRGY